MNQKPKGYLTISVDDGHTSDWKAAELLDRFGFQATFYIPAQNPEREVLAPQEIRRLSQRFEIGGHTYNHRPLKRLSSSEAWAEISDGKKWMDDLLGKPTVSFCYPQGKYTRETAHLVKKAGFLGARTCMFNLNDAPADPFHWGVSTHAYSHSPSIQLRHALIEGNFSGARNFVSVFGMERDWARHFERALEQVETQGGIAHLYFHSWEIDEQQQWEKLESVLENASKRSGLRRVTNGELFSGWYGNA